METVDIKEGRDETNQVGKQASTSDIAEQENCTARQDMGAIISQVHHTEAIFMIISNDR